MVNTRTGGEHQLPLSVGLEQHAGAGDVRRQNVDRELDPAESQVERLGQGSNQQCLAGTRDSFEEDVAPSEQSHQNLLDHVVVTDDHTSDFATDLIEGVPGTR